ncbi:uncharacterized protein si:ch211-178n15.1 [Osmerus eperlanus]|uniref:uncharacterized protein si:ch211-178n15.1 n=1 Tax=Osmerus eperlanus TaxID=29151 RepID=UPI002E0EB64C
MFSDSTRTGHYRFQQQNVLCHCGHCTQYGSPYPGVLGYPRTPPKQALDHPSLDRQTDKHSPFLNEVEGGDFGLEREGRDGHRNPQRRPVFTGPGPYSQMDNFSQNCSWDFHPAQCNYPAVRDQGERHYSPVQGEQCGGCVICGDAGMLPFNGRHVPQLPLPPVQFRGQLRPRPVNYMPEPEPRWGCGGCEHYPSDTRVPEHFHSPPAVTNGHCVPRPLFTRAGETRDSHLDWSKLRGGSKGSCSRHQASHKSFFSTEVPQRDLHHPLRRPRLLPPCSPGMVHAGDPERTDLVTPQGSDPERPKGGSGGSVRDQIRQVVTDLEGVLGGLKQVHVEMKEVVQQIDHLTANIDLSKESPSPSLTEDTPHPGALGDIQVYNHKTNGALPPKSHRDTADTVILQTNSPSPVYMASVVKTNRVMPPSPQKDPHPDRRGVNGHLPLPCPLRDTNHLTQLDPTPPPRTLDPTVIVGNSTSLSRSQKPPPYPHNGRVEKASKGLAPPPPTFLRTPPYPAGKRRQSSSMV